MAKRLRRKPYKDGELCMYWGHESPGEPPDILIQRGAGVPRCDGALTHWALCSLREHMNYTTGKEEFLPSFIDELKSRGYDITTLKFSIQKAAHAAGGTP